MWKGPHSDLPPIPPLQQPTEYHGLDKHNNIVTVCVLSNAIECDQAIRDTDRVVHGYGYSRGVLVTGVTGAGAVLDPAALQYTVNPYLWFAVFHGYL
jgi:hypothetical protein